MDRSKKIISCSSRVIVNNQKLQNSRNMTVHEGVKKLLANNQKAQELFTSNKVDVIVKLKSNGSVSSVLLIPKNVISSSDDSLYCSCTTPSAPTDKKQIEYMDMETLPTAVRDDKKLDSGRVNECDDADQTWWRQDSTSEEEEDIDLDLTLELDDDNEAESMEVTLIPDMIEATQLPPEKISGMLKNEELPMDDEFVKPDSTASLEEETDEKSDDDEEEAWKKCWNCKAPKPIAGIYREDANSLRMTFCCEKPTRIKPTNNAIIWSTKCYPYDSWVHHSCS